MKLKFKSAEELAEDNPLLEEVEPTTDPEDLDEEEDLEDDLLGDDLGDDFLDDTESNPPLEKHKDLLKLLTDFAPFLKNTVNNWLGVQWDEEKKEFVKCKDVTPVMNIQGAAWAIGRIQTYARENNIITDISKDDYMFLQEDIIEEFWLNIGTRAKEFGIKKEGDILRVCNEMIHSAMLVLMGAGDGRYNKFLGTTITQTHNITDNPNNQNQNSPRSPQISTGARFKRAIFGKV